MKILLANYRYFISGGPERYLFNASSALVARGHEVIPYSIDYSNNHSTPYSKYFAPPLGRADEIYFNDHQRTLSSTLRTVERLFYSVEVERSISELVKVVKPQVAYVLHYLRKLSPSLLVGLKKARIPIVVRLSDYQMLCPQAHFLAGDKVCTECLCGSLLPSVRNRCIKDSYLASLLNVLATHFHNNRKYFDLIDAFVVTNKFMMDLMLSAGFHESRIHLIPTFVPHVDMGIKSKYILREGIVYVGRLDYSKGVHILLEALKCIKERRPDLDFPVNIIGKGDPTYEVKLRSFCEEHLNGLKINFLGNLPTEHVMRYFQSSVASVVPSIWYENLPNSMLESMACGTPVIASNIGSLMDVIQEGFNGLKFDAGDHIGLMRSIIKVLDSPSFAYEMGRNTVEYCRANYSEESHMTKLLELFDKLTACGN